MGNTSDTAMAEKTHGNLLAVLSSIFQSSVLVFWTYLLGFLSKPVLMVYWFGLAMFILAAFLFISKSFKFSFNKRTSFTLLGFGLLSAFTTFLLLTSASLVGASITSFLMQATVIFVLAYSILGLKETLTKKELVGIITIALGLLVLNWDANFIITISSLIVLLAAFSQATGDFLAKKLLVDVPKLQLNFVRITIIFLFGLAYFFITTGSFVKIDLTLLAIMFVGVLIGPIFTFVFYYASLQKTKLANANALKSISPIFTFILAFLFLGELLTIQQAGALILVMAGVYLIIRK